MSQDNIFRGGIQRGTTAFDEHSSFLDKSIKNSRDILKEQVSNKWYSKPKLTYDDKIKYVGSNCFSFAPDGGLWFKDGLLKVVFEGKKQNKAGNAYERWWDNAVTAKYINPNVIYVTFCSGPGAIEGECLHKLSVKARIMMGENFRFYLNPMGFEENEIYSIMKKTLDEVI
jgi:hypothetical protein